MFRFFHDDKFIPYFFFKFARIDNDFNRRLACEIGIIRAVIIIMIFIRDGLKRRRAIFLRAHNGRHTPGIGTIGHRGGSRLPYKTHDTDKRKTASDPKT